MSAAVLLLSMSAHAESLLDFGKGPAQWLMTSEEQRAWKQVRTEAQARDFADLFWARRDPTPGTYPNEFRVEFNERVKVADERFAESRRRGALSERGRVLIVLGYPKNMGAESMKRSAMYSAGSGPDALDPSGGRLQAARDVWEYEREAAMKFGMPKIEVVFIHDGLGDSVRRDPQRTDFSSALPRAIQYYIKNPDIKTVPAWAREAQLTMVPGVQIMEATVPMAVQAQPGREEGAPAAVSRNAADVASTSAPKVAARQMTRPAGATKLTLVRDAFALEPQGGSDIFAGLTSVDVFKKTDELGWAAEYCAAGDVPTVDVTLKISGLIKGEKVNFNAPAEELAPDQIKGVPGCYLVRGAIPLSEMDPGEYTVFVKIGNYNLSNQFRLEQ